MQPEYPNQQPRVERASRGPRRELQMLPTPPSSPGAWGQFWQDVGLGWHGVIEHLTSGRAERAARGGRGQLVRSFGAPAPRAARRPLIAVAALALACTLASTGGVVSALNLLDARTAAHDATAQVDAIQALLKTGSYLDTDTLLHVQTRLGALDADLQRIQGDIPLEPLVAGLPRAGSAVHVVRMASALVHAGEAGIDAALTLVPHLKGALSSLESPSATPSPHMPTPSATRGSSTPAPGGTSDGPLTLADMNHVSADLTTAGADLEQALGERAEVHDADLRALGLASAIPMLHKLDAAAPELPGYLHDAQVIAAALPALLGITKPVSYLLIDQDSDELRPTGGFMGNFAVLTLSGGRLTDGVHLHDIYQLDCPNGACPFVPIPQRFAWMNADPTQFALRDSNLDPDFPTSARFAEQLFAQEHGPPVAGTIYLTPALIEQILQITGPISAPPFDTPVTAQNLRPLIHYYHIAGGSGVALGSQYQTSDRKAFDAVLGGALLKRVGSLSQGQQGAVAHVALNALATRDLQLYFNDPNGEGVLSARGLDGSVAAPQGDSLYVVDANTGATYANADVQEHIADSISLDANGSATHDLTIAYTYPVVSHVYDALYEQSGIFWTYHDFVRVIVPTSARLISQQGCASYATTQAKHAVWACHIVLARSNSLTLRFRWIVPAAVATAGGRSEYRLLVQRQPGAHDGVSIAITPPGHSRPTVPLQAPLVAGANGSARYADALIHDERFVVRFTA